MNAEYPCPLSSLVLAKPAARSSVVKNFAFPNESNVSVTFDVGYLSFLVTLFSLLKSTTNRLVPSFLSIINTGAAHGEFASRFLTSNPVFDPIHPDLHKVLGMPSDTPGLLPGYLFRWSPGPSYPNHFHPSKK